MPQCLDVGYYLSPRCASARIDCGHADLEVVSRDKDGKVLESKAIMPCPKRPCRCAAGAPYREELVGRIHAQDEQMAAIDQSYAATGSAR